MDDAPNAAAPAPLFATANEPIMVEVTHPVQRAPAPANKDAVPPTAAEPTLHTDDSASRKMMPVADGVMGYFPDAIAYVAFVSFLGNQKHNPGEPLHWARGKSSDHLNCIARHLTTAGLKDGQGVRHSGNLAWRALANLQLELEKDLWLPRPRNVTD
jgi:hypothetical protein